jgi:hypothetical protein
MDSARGAVIDIPAMLPGKPIVASRAVLAVAPLEISGTLAIGLTVPTFSVEDVAIVCCNKAERSAAAE